MSAKEYKANCPNCKNEIVIKVKDDKIVEVLHNNKTIDISESSNFKYEFG